MPDWLVQLLASSPAAAVALICLLRLLRYLDGRDEKDAKREDRFLAYMVSRDEALAKTLLGMGEDCHSVQQRAVAALDRNTAALGSVESTLKTAATATERAAAVIERHARESVRGG